MLVISVVTGSRGIERVKQDLYRRNMLRDISVCIVVSGGSDRWMKRSGLEREAGG